MDKLTFYTNPRSRGRIARWMLEEIGQPYETVVLDYGAPMRSPAYLELNPMGKVPTVTHGPRVITETAAICAYLADAFPEAGLLPANRASYYRWLFFAAGPFEAAVIDRALGLQIPPERTVMVGYGDFDRTIATLEQAVSASPFIAGESFSAADVQVGLQIGWGLEFGTIPDRPAFRAYWNRLKDRPALLRANALDDALARGSADA
ncbi:glutathione S-transferase family protein [Cereibacter azotoformans]|uniref:glutathione S-transferase family protein n=1 Tax=Cereibacter azotoformans TaxID=43057 RepID=UPI001EEC08B2|nr:glutathione S-transferase family protein [Cereibacter azotoformans]ULB08564.1 glutathione S-transferase family protein [Cereibacter azotoformans]